MNKLSKNCISCRMIEQLYNNRRTNERNEQKNEEKRNENQNEQTNKWTKDKKLN